jgi:hypothetical protein
MEKSIMAIRYSALSRENLLSVSADGNTYTTCSGINNVMFGRDTNMTEDTGFDSNGIRTNLPTSVEFAFKFEGWQRFTDTTLATRDAGQVIIATAAANLGNGSLIYGRFTHATASGVLNFTARVVLDETGGGNDDLMSFNGTFYLTDRPTGTGHYSKQAGSSS